MDMALVGEYTSRFHGSTPRSWLYIVLLGGRDLYGVCPCEIRPVVASSSYSTDGGIARACVL